MAKSKIVITTWRVPFSQIVKGCHEFLDDQRAVNFINEASQQWWEENEGGRSIAEMGGEPYDPINSLFDSAHYELWGGEVGFHAMLDEQTYWRVHEAHYKAEYDDQGKSRPGYLRNAYGENTQSEIDQVHAFYSSKH